MVGGNYNELNKDKLRSWVQAGGTLVLTEEAVTWASQNGITDVKFKRFSLVISTASRRDRKRLTELGLTRPPQIEAP